MFLCCLLHHDPVGVVDSFSVSPVWSECVCVVCVLARGRRFLFCVWRFLPGPDAVVVDISHFLARVVVCVSVWVVCVLVVSVRAWIVFQLLLRSLCPVYVVCILR